MSSLSPYPEAFFDNVAAGARDSAEQLVPIVLELLRPRSVVDVGCGRGVWLRIFTERGVPDVFGVDGDYIERDKLEIPRDRFLAADLTAPMNLGRRFDLSVSLEVAEHLPESAAGTYIETLVSLAPAVLFSAAIPNQGGIHHVNEQWPRYWADHFHNHGYVCIDCLRMRLWQLDKVQPWYAQNSLLFVSRELLHENRNLAREYDRHGGPPLPLVHPGIWSFPNPIALLRRLRGLGLMTDHELEAKRQLIIDRKRSRQNRRSDRGS